MSLLGNIDDSKKCFKNCHFLQSQTVLLVNNTKKIHNILVLSARQPSAIVHVMVKGSLFRVEFVANSTKQMDRQSLFALVMSLTWRMINLVPRGRDPFG